MDKRPGQEHKARLLENWRIGPRARLAPRTGSLREKTKIGSRRWDMNSKARTRMSRWPYRSTDASNRARYSVRSASRQERSPTIPRMISEGRPTDGERGVRHRVPPFQHFLA